MLCSYCGNTAGIHRHHEVPVSYTSLKRNYKRGTTIPACAECNLLLSDNMFTTREDAAHYLLAKYRKRYKKVLSMPKWNEEELEDMSKAFQSSIKATLLQKEILEERLTNLKICAGIQTEVYQD